MNESSEVERRRLNRLFLEGLLGDALAVFPRERGEAVAAVSALLDDPARRRRMGEIGRARMGEPGAARRIAERVAALLSGA